MPRRTRKGPPKGLRKPNSRRTSRRTRADAARENGKLGGRPRKLPTVESFDDLGPPPEGPLEAIRWAQRLLMLDLDRMRRGARSEADKELSRDMRSTAAVAAKLMPADVTVEALRLLQADGAQIEADTGPEEVAAASLGEGRPTRSIGR